MAINLESLSITSVFNSIVAFFNSQENNTRWKKLTSTSEGGFLIRLLSNVFSAISYRIVAQSRENYISTAALTSSNIGIAQNLGYSVFRGSNLKRKVGLIPSSSYTYPKLSVIGQYSDLYDIITLEDVALEEGVYTEFNTVVGKIKEEVITVDTPDIKAFTLFTPNISNDFILFLGSKEVPTTDVIKEMTDDKYLVRTNPYQSVDIMYLNTYKGFKYKYGTDSEITIRYVELADVPVVDYMDSMFDIGTLRDFSTISLYKPFETVEKIKVNAPLHHELQNLIRSKADYANRLREMVKTVKDCNFNPLTPTYTLVTYLKDDFTLLTAAEKEEVLRLLKNENFFGTPLPDITVPRREVVALNIDLALTNKYKNISDIELDINNIIDNYYNAALSVTFNTFDLERRIEELSYVRYCRVSYKIRERQPNVNYQLGYIISHEGNKYEAAQILGSTGPREPVWNVPFSGNKDIDTGLETVDNSIVWRCYKALPNMPLDSLTSWQANSQFGLGEYVYTKQYPNYMFKCVDLLKNSGKNTPSLTGASLGDFIIDGGIVWVVRSRVDAEGWSSYTTYRLGDYANVSSAPEVSLECISYTGTVGTEETLEFNLPSYGVLSYNATEFTIKGNKTFYIRVNDIISAAHSGGYTVFSVASSTYNGDTGNTTIKVNQGIDTSLSYTSIFAEERGTRDGQILWKLIDDSDDVQYSWKSYVTFEYDLDIIGG